MGNGSGKQAELKVNQKIILWTKGKLGAKVGRGQCWDLAEQALKQAGAQTSNDLGPVDENTDYIWGDSIEKEQGIERGDILQIRDHVTKTTTEVVYRFADETKVWETRERIAKRGHHTAIVRSKPDVNGMMKTYEQHVNGRDVVQKMGLYLRSVSPTVTHSVGVYPHPRTKKKERVNITTTITIEVTGKIWPYRPKSK